MKKKMLEEMLVHALYWVASKCSTQIEALPDYKEVLTDEIAQTYSETFLLVENNKDYFTHEQYIKLKALDDHFAELTTMGDHLWTLDALANNKEWELSRLLAKEALLLMGYSVIPSSLLGLKHIDARDK